VKHLYLIYHVPKTGGQTIRDHLNRTLKLNHDFMHTGRWVPTDSSISLTDIADLSSVQKARLRALTGHLVTREIIPAFPQHRCREVLILREPAARLASHYNFKCTMVKQYGDSSHLASTMPTFEEFLSSVGQSQMTKSVARMLKIENRPTRLSDVLAELENLWMVGTLGSLDRLLPHLFNAIGVDPSPPSRSNVSGGTIERHVTLTPQLADEIRAKNHEDVMLYEAALRLEQRTLERFGLPERQSSRRGVLFAP